MTKEQKPLFEILDNLWSLIKPYANEDDEKTYKKIMSDCFKMLFKDRGEKYTDAWWDSTRDVIDYPEKYKGTKYVDFATDMAVAFLDYWKFNEHKGDKATYYDFMTYVSRAFINEWEKRRDEKVTTQTAR